MKDKEIKQLYRIYRYYQLVGVIPFSMTFEQYIVFMKELYGNGNYGN